MLLKHLTTFKLKNKHRHLQGNTKTLPISSILIPYNSGLLAGLLVDPDMLGLLQKSTGPSKLALTKTN